DLRDVREELIRARDLTDVLEAVGQVELGADSGVELLALLELRARLGVAPGGRERVGLVEQPIGGLLRGLRPRGARREKRHEGGASERVARTDAHGFSPCASASSQEESPAWPRGRRMPAPSRSWPAG